MAKKHNKEASKPKKPLEKRAKESAREFIIDQEKSFDFGGLPNRDLKKNIGCG